MKTTAIYVERTKEEINANTDKMLASRKKIQDKLPATHQIDKSTGTPLEHPTPAPTIQTTLGRMGPPTAHMKVVPEKRKPQRNLVQKRLVSLRTNE